MKTTVLVLLFVGLCACLPALPEPKTVPADYYKQLAISWDPQVCVDFVNAFRASLGVPPLTRNKDKESCVDKQAAYDSTHGAHAAFGQCQEYGQCECPNWPNSLNFTQCLQQMINEGPGGGHYEIMKNPNYKSIACGFSYASSTYEATQDYFY